MESRKELTGEELAAHERNLEKNAKDTPPPHPDAENKDKQE